MISKFWGRSGHPSVDLSTEEKVAEEISGVVRRGSGIETSVLSYDGTSIPTGARRILWIRLRFFTLGEKGRAA